VPQEQDGEGEGDVMKKKKKPNVKKVKIELDEDFVDSDMADKVEKYIRQAIEQGVKKYVKRVMDVGRVHQSFEICESLNAEFSASANKNPMDYTQLIKCEFSMRSVMIERIDDFTSNGEIEEESIDAMKIMRQSLLDIVSIISERLPHEEGEGASDL
jgi:hypothetical protein